MLYLPAGFTGEMAVVLAVGGEDSVIAAEEGVDGMIFFSLFQKTVRCSQANSRVSFACVMVQILSAEEGTHPAHCFLQGKFLFGGALVHLIDNENQ